MKAYKYKVTKVEEFLIEAEDEQDAADSLRSILVSDGLNPDDDALKVELLDITDWGKQTVAQAVTRRNVTAVSKRKA